jgi:hypothetical protein
MRATQPHLSPAFPRKPRKFDGPVRWLFGRQLISSLKWIALYAAFQDKLDAKDWMQAEVIPVDIDGRTNAEFWFDYIADVGDSQKAAYSIAYLCMSDLYLQVPLAKGPPPIGSGVATDGDEDSRLPRGTFLFVGGDTSYHIADFVTLAQRFQWPFCWAFEDLQQRGKITDERRPIFAIPGNHDHYDALDGFNRQFRQPLTKEDQALILHAGTPQQRQFDPQLRLEGFKRGQQASYVALKLPFNWWLWGLDLEADKIDLRQLDFFKNRTNGGRVPDKLIVATPSPTTVFGKYQRTDSELAKTFAKLGLERPFLKYGKEPLGEGKCRLDLSGDTHHYARYWGPGADGTSASAPSASHYASVVSGLGGAFLHPSHTNVHEVEAQVLYPPAARSRWEVAKRILMPWNILTGGIIGIIGGITAILLGLTIPVTPWSLLGPQNPDPMGFLYSLGAFSFMIASGVVIYLSFRSSKALFERARRRQQLVKTRSTPVIGFLLGLALLPLGICIFGQHSAVRLLSDLVFALIVFGAVVGLPAFAWYGSEVLEGRDRFIFLALGLWHAILSLAVPFFLVWVGSWRAWVLALGVAFVFIWIGIVLAQWDSPWPILLAWAVHGLGQLGFPWVFPGPVHAQLEGVRPFMDIPWLLPIAMGLIIGILGMIMTCVWFCWYLAVSLALNGHNNEAGGAARIERFKQFIRFRLTENEVTGYVIGVDTPQTDGCDLTPTIVDVFTVGLQDRGGRSR